MSMLLRQGVGVFALSLLAAISVAGAAEEDDATAWDRYVPGSISAITGTQTALVCARAGAGRERPVWTIPGEDHARKALVIYTGLSRPTSALRRQMLSNWLKSFGLPQKTVHIFPREYLFHEDDGAYWMPVQEPVAAYFSDELKPNAPVCLYLVWAGAHCVGDRVTWLFLVNEFEALEAMPTGTRPSVT